MNSDREHPGLDVLNDYVDERLASSARSSVSAHLEECEPCRLEHDRLVELLQSAGALPRSVLPPTDIWGDIRASIDERKEIVLPGARSRAISEADRPLAGRPWWTHRAALVAAALVLMFASSGVTALVLRSQLGSTIVYRDGELDASGASKAPQMLPASFRRAEGEFLRTIDELRVALQAQRAVLKPETVAAVEHSLTVVDLAIEEARQALLNDPSNLTLLDLLTASYERKLDLLRRAADLEART